MTAKLTIVKGPNVDHVHELLDDQVLTLGRSPKADIRVLDDDASRKHCRIERIEGYWTITDLDSLNGTFVNEQRITQKRLHSGELIRVASTEYRFTVEERTERGSGLDARLPSDESQEAAVRVERPVCAQCGRELPENPLADKSATEIGGRLFCSRCVVRHSGDEPDEQQEEQKHSTDSSELGPLLRSLERATAADGLDAAEPAPPPEEPEPPKSGRSLLDRLRPKKPKD